MPVPYRPIVSEYESKYGRQLWDEATRTNYFQLVSERNARMLRGTHHSPIHWDHDPKPDKENKAANSRQEGVIKRVSPEPPKPKRLPSAVPKSKCTLSEPQKRVKSDVCDCKCCNCPCNTKTCCTSKCCIRKSSSLREGVSRCSTSSRQSFVHKERDSKIDARTQSTSGRGQKYAKVVRENITTPTPERVQKQQKPNLPIQLPKSVPPSKPQPPIYRQESAPTAKKANTNKQVDSEKQPPFAMYGLNNDSTRRTYNVRPNSQEVHSSALRAKKERERLHQFRKSSIQPNKKGTIKQPHAQVPVKLFVDALCTQNKPKAETYWVSEYQRNYKPYVF